MGLRRPLVVVLAAVSLCVGAGPARATAGGHALHGTPPPCGAPLGIHDDPKSGAPGTAVHTSGCTGGAPSVQVYFRDVSTGTRTFLGYGAVNHLLRVWSLDVTIPADATGGHQELDAIGGSHRAHVVFNVTG